MSYSELSASTNKSSSPINYISQLVFIEFTMSVSFSSVVTKNVSSGLGPSSFCEVSVVGDICMLVASVSSTSYTLRSELP